MKKCATKLERGSWAGERNTLAAREKRHTESVLFFMCAFSNSGRAMETAKLCIPLLIRDELLGGDACADLDKRLGITTMRTTAWEG